jgi:hypothetical protein
MQQHPILVLLDLGRDFAQGEDHGRGLRRGEGRVGECVQAERMVQDVGAAGEPPPRGVGEERRCGRTVAVEVTLDGLDIVCTIPARAVELCIPLVGWGRCEGSHDKPRIVPSGHDCCLDDHAFRLGPRGSGIGAGVIPPTAGGRRLPRALCQGGPLPEQVAGLVHDWGGWPEEHGLPREATDNIHPTPRGDHFHDLWGGTVTIASDQERGGGPVTPEVGQEPHQDQRVFRAGGTLSGAEAGSHESMGGAFKHEQGQRAITLIVMVREGAFLRTMGGSRGVIEVEAKRRWRLGGAGNAVVNKRLRKAGEIGARDAVFEPGEGRSTRQVLPRIERDAFDAQREHGIVPETIGIMAIRIARRDVIDALGAEVPKRMVNRRGMTFVAYCSGHTFGEADLSVDPAQSERPQVGRQGATVNISP